MSYSVSFGNVWNVFITGVIKKVEGFVFLTSKLYNRLTVMQK